LGIVLPLYIAGICWTLHYDTIYAHQDKKDDTLVGIKSTALRFGDNTKYWLSLFSTLCIGGLVLSGYSASISMLPFLVGMSAAASHLVWQIATLDINNERDCGAKFRSNKVFGAIVFLAFVLGKIFV